MRVAPGILRGIVLPPHGWPTALAWPFIVGGPAQTRVPRAGAAEGSGEDFGRRKFRRIPLRAQSRPVGTERFLDVAGPCKYATVPGRARWEPGLNEAGPRARPVRLIIHPATLADLP